MKKLFFILPLFIASCSCTSKKTPVYIEYFKNGQIIPPDGLCEDSLIVIDAVSLNKAVSGYEQGFYMCGDDELDSVFHKYCKLFKTNKNK